MRWSYLFVLLMFSLKASAKIRELHNILKRSLLFPQFTILQFTYGVSAPVILPKRSINLSLCAQCNFELPFNSTQLIPSVISAKSSEYGFDLDRNTFYKYVIGVLDGVGLNGEQCLLRTICEVGEIPMHVQQTNSLLEDIVHYLLTPSEDYVLSDNYLEDASFDQNYNFIEAEKVGKTTGNCYEKFTGCSVSLVDLFTKLYFI